MATVWLGKAVWPTMGRVMLCENRCKPGAKPGVRPVSGSTAAHKTRVYGSCANAHQGLPAVVPFTRQEKGASQEAHIYSRVAQLVRAAAL